jgi:PAS domain S-box-containing protein
MKSTEHQSATVLPSDGLVPLESVLCTEELNRRPTRPPDYERENRALVSLAQALAESPRTILQTLADKILEVFEAGSAGLSLLTKGDGGKRFHWPAIAGMWKPHIGGGTPRDFGPCGDVLDRNAPLLFKHFERRYTYFLPVTPLVEECLLVPFYVEGEAVGTIWAIAHDDRRKFDAEDMRQLVSLGRFASSAYQAVAFLDALEQQSETLRQSHADLAQSMAELRQTNARAQDSRRAALNLMEDAVLSRQAIETLNVELRESEERYRSLFASAPMAVFVCDHNAVIQHYNQRATELWGRGPVCGVEQHCGWVKLWLPDGTLLPHAQSPIMEVLRTGLPARNVEMFIERPDGSRLPVLVNFAALKNARGEITGAIASFIDITDRKRAEESLKESDRRKNEFLAMLAHELRNPLAPIRNALEVLRLEEGTREAAQAASAMMERQIGQMVRLVDDLLDVSRISRGKIELRTGSIELASSVNHAVEAARSLCESKGLNLTVTLPAQPIYLNADPVRLAQVVGNLLNNATKFTDRGGRIWLTAEVVTSGELESEKNAEHGDSGAQASGTQDAEAGSEELRVNHSSLATPYVIIRVRDTGIGIAGDQFPRIFEMFTQVDTSLERTRSGLGIGLTLAKNLVELHGGTMEVHSPGAGQGSEFVVRLPILVEAPQPTPPEAAVSELKTAPGRRILIVDDNEDSAESLTILLSLAGNETRTAYDGLEAIEAAETFKPDVILLDIGLPKLNGYEVARKIREQPWGQTIVLVALTGWGQEEDRRRTREAGFNHHLTKPVDPLALTKLLAGLSVAQSCV